MVQQNKNLLVGNGPLLTLDEHMPFLENGAVYMQDGRILDVGEWKVLKEKYPQAPLLDAEGMLIMPGWINGHHHIYSAFARGMLQPGPAPRDFLSILEKVWWNIDRHLTLEQDYYSSVATFLECIRNGVTTVIDHHASYFAIEGSLDALAEGASLIGIRACLCYEISDRDGKEKALASVRENRRFLESLKTRDQTMLAGLMGMHASFTLPDWLLEYARQENTTGAGYHIHVAEGAYDQEHCLSHYGCTVVERLVKWGILGPDSLAGHGIHITAKDRALLMASGATLMHNPESNMANGVGTPNITGFFDEGLKVGLGTDGYTSDILESAKTANILQKHRGMPDRGFSETMEMLLRTNGETASRLFGLPLGTLQPGAGADLILVDYQPYTPLTGENYKGHILFGLSGAMTDTTIINGKLLMRHRKFTLPGVETLLEASRKEAAALWRSMYE